MFKTWLVHIIIGDNFSLLYCPVGFAEVVSSLVPAFGKLDMNSFTRSKKEGTRTETTDNNVLTSGIYGLRLWLY